MIRKEGLFCSLRFSQLYDTEGLCCKHQPWFGRIVAYASRGLDIHLPPSEGPRNFLHISDAAHLLVRAAETRIRGCWSACHPESLETSRIAEIAYEEFACRGGIIIDPAKVPFRHVSYPTDQSLFEHLHDRPRISIAEGIAMIHRSGCANRFGPMDVK